MKQFARTLLILGSVTACERAHPEADPAPRTRLTQPEAPKPAAAVPLVNAHDAPAVGNIGQTGAPRTVERPRRVQRVVRAATIPRAIENPDPLQRPDLPQRVPPSKTTRLEFRLENQAGFQLTQERPLVNERERPAHANMGRRASIAEIE